MSTPVQATIDFLLANACVQIRYLVHRDFLGAPIDEPFMRRMQEEICLQSNTLKHFSAQHPDGWFGHELHGNDGMDRHIGDLLNMGVDPDHPRIQQAVTALTTPSIAAQHKNWFRGGDALDADGRGGNRAVIAGILSRVGYPEDAPMLAAETALAFEHLTAVLRYRSVDDFSTVGGRQRYYLPGVRFPGENHIGLLANTHAWRSESRMAVARSAMKHGFELMKDFDGQITFRKPRDYGSGFVGPFNYNWQALKPITEEELRRILESPYHFQFGFWLRAVGSTPDWARQSTQTYELLANLLGKGDFTERIPGKSLHAFRQIMGIEPAWRTRIAVQCDVTFALLRACRCIAAKP